MRRWGSLGACLLLGSPLLAQELNCTVTIDASQLVTVQVAEKQVFVEMKRAIQDFINNRRWTNDAFNPGERINCNLVLTLLRSPAIGSFEGTAQIQSSRPIHGTGYETVLFGFIDREFQFQYIQSQPMDFNENVFTSNLTSALAFYAYVVLGVDYDSFGKLGGSAPLQRAFAIANNAQQANEKGWKAFEDNRNRYWLIENLMSQQMVPFREGVYTYHRLVLDAFNADPEKARGQLLEVLNQLKQMNQLKPASVLLNSYLDAKANELIGIFKEASPLDKQRAYALLVELDPTKTDRYQQITE
ncbi:MAG: DUF4835 family protein [Ferruginibacter sp.]|nr:DUF4835 family protein [Cytophagales bacterium]